MKKLTREDLTDILYGCAVLGTGGGGSLDEGLAMIDEALAAGREFTLADFSEMDPEAIVGTPYACGAISPLTEEEIRKYARLKPTEESFYILCMRQLESFLGRELGAVISTELGGGNTATALYVGAMTGRPVMDGDPAGRSVPALQHSTYFLGGVPMCPMSVMNRFGEGAVFTHVFDDERGEDMVRALAVVSQNHIAVMDHVNTAEVIGRNVIRGAISHAGKIGRAFREAKAAGGDFVAAVTEAGGGKMMFRGAVTESGYETRDGYTYGDTVIAGEGEYAGHELHIGTRTRISSAGSTASSSSPCPTSSASSTWTSGCRSSTPTPAWASASPSPPSPPRRSGRPSAGSRSSAPAASATTRTTGPTAEEEIWTTGFLPRCAPSSP